MSKFEAYVSGTGWLYAKGHDEIDCENWVAVIQLTQEQCNDIREFLGPHVDQIVKD